MRLIAIPADAEQGLGIFENLHEAESGDALAKRLEAACREYKGAPIRVFLEHLVQRAEVIAATLKDEIEDWLQRYLPKNADGQVTRVARRFALVAAAGELAASLGILPWPDDEASRAAGSCFEAWLQRRGGAQSAELIAGVSQVRLLWNSMAHRVSS